MTAEILVIREKDRFSSILVEQGFQVTNFPTIKTVPLEDLSELEKCLDKIEIFDGIFITSFKATEIFLQEYQKGKRNFNGKFYVLGRKSKDYLETAEFKIFYDENAATAEALVEAIPQTELLGKKFLFLRGNRSLRVISKKLQNVAEVQEIVIYETVATDFSEKQTDKIRQYLTDHKFAAVCFFSPSGVEEFLKIFKGFRQTNAKVAVIGKTTAKFAEENHLRVDFVSEKPGAETYAHGLAEYLRKGI